MGPEAFYMSLKEIHIGKNLTILLEYDHANKNTKNL